MINPFKSILLVSSLFILLGLNGQDTYTINGFVRDASTGEELLGANVVLMNGEAGTMSNEYGYYSLTTGSGRSTILYSYVGYHTRTFPLQLYSDTVLNVELEKLSLLLDEVTVSANRTYSNISSLETGATRLPVHTLRMIPALLGEVDVIKAIQLLPGVQVTSEGSSGFSVRGGGRDQNLILLDEATLYNPSHLLGFLSVFNNDAIKDVKLYKGDIPASSGGRLSSLLDVRMKEGNKKQFSASGGIGTIASRLTLEGPIVRDKISYLLSARRTYADLFLKLASDKTLSQNRLFFHDFNTKLNFVINERNRIYLSGYYGRDVFANDYAGMYFGNRALTFRWNHLFSKKLFSNFSFLNTHYFYDLGTPEGSFQHFNWKSYLDDFGFKGDFIWYLSSVHTFRFGASATYHIIKPGTIITDSPGGISQQAELDHDQALESGAYFSGESNLGKRFSLRYGLRYSRFSNVGPATVYSYNDKYQVTDSTLYEIGDFFNSYQGMEPRFAANYMLNDNQAVKASYSRAIQYLQLASNSTAGTPLEIWFPSSPNIKPQVSDQVSVGYFRNFLDFKLETSLELYYKEMSNSIDFRDHAELMLNPKLEGELRIGDAVSYGAELYLKYESKNFMGWISYTLSRTMRTFPDINEGVPYPAPYDKPHDLALVLGYRIFPRISLGLNWIYSTGLPYTFPSGRYEVMGNILPLYTGRNEYRLPDYHRLDLSVTVRGKEKAGKRWSGEWVFSAYNAYARKNVWTLNFRQDSADPNVTYAEMTYLFSIVPAITYNFKF